MNYNQCKINDIKMTNCVGTYTASFLVLATPNCLVWYFLYRTAAAGASFFITMFTLAEQE